MADDREMSIKAMSDERKDFVKRLFAVTISVGFATQIAQLVHQIKAGSGTWHLVESVGPQQWHELGLLAASLIAVVLSWEGYLTSIYRDPIETRPRFYLDVFIVFVYLLLMLFSSKSELWFSTLTFMFLVYLIWDILKAWERARRETRASESVARIPLVANGLITTLTWLIVIVAIYHFKHLGTSLSFAFALASAISVLVFYRIDKVLRGRGGWLPKIALVVVPVTCLILSARIR